MTVLRKDPLTELVWVTTTTQVWIPPTTYYPPGPASPASGPISGASGGRPGFGSSGGGGAGGSGPPAFNSYKLDGLPGNWPQNNDYYNPGWVL